MMLKEELEEIVEKEKDIIPFLKKLTTTEKKELVPFLKKLKEEYYKTKEVRSKSGGFLSMSYEHIKSETQRKLVEKACFVCCNKKDIKRLFWGIGNIAASDEYISEIIPWYVPNWYSSVINEEMPWELTYEKMMRLYKDGLLDPSHELILNKLPNAIVEHQWKDNKRISFYKPEILNLHKETLDQHIWLLFEEESFINNYYNYLGLENYSGGNDIWINTIVNLIEENKLARNKVLTATIYTSTKGFNKTLSGWFFDLLVKLNPTEEEVLDLQDALFAALNSPHSKVINTVLKYFKAVANHKKFKTKIFIDNSSIILNSETKSVVNSTLMILDKIAKSHKNSKISICCKAAETLINVDEKIQLRAAKIIEKHGDLKSQELKEEVSLYADNLYHGTKEILKEYISVEEDIDDFQEKAEPVNFLTENNRLPSYETLDDLIFFVSQAIDNNEVFHIDLLLSHLPKLYALLNSSNVSKLEPIFKRSLDLSMNFEWSGQIGNLESEAAFYLNDFAEILMKKYPTELESFRKTKNQKIEKLKQDRFYGSHYKENLKEIEYQSIPDYIYQIHHALFIKSKSLIKKNLTLELLSTPTHNPCWIDPMVLIERIIAFEKSDEEMDLYDFQIAVGRLPLNQIPPNISKKIEGIKERNIRDVLNYHLGFNDLSKMSIQRPELWLQSVLSRGIKSEITFFQEHFSNTLQKEIGVYDWDCGLHDHFYKEYDYTTGKHVQKKMVRKQLEFRNFNPEKKEPDSFVNNLKALFNKKPVKIQSIYEYMYFKKQQYYTTIRPNDEVKFLLLSPNNTSAFLSQVIHNNLKESTFSDETSKKNMVNLLKGLHQVWYRQDYSETTYLFLATGFLCSDKISRELAAEIWIKANSENNMDNTFLGEMIGRLESGQYAPMQRLTDLLVSNLLNVSQKHNNHLFSLINGTIGKMDNVPIRGVKKLLEIFLELRHGFPKKEINKSAVVNLLKWKENTSLKPVISKLLQ